MSQFEFLRYVNLGQYLPTGSIIHQMDARIRILCFILLIGCVTFLSNPLALAIAFAFIFGLLLMAKVPAGFALRNLLPPLPFLLFLALLQVLFNPRPDSSQVLWQWWLVKITPESLLEGGLLLLRFAALILTLSLASYCISTSELIHGLERLLSPLDWVGIRTRPLVMMVQVMLRFLPFLALSAERIAKAQASRGARWGTRKGNLVQQVRQVVPLIVPLFLTGLRRAENLALAMDGRGFGNGLAHTSRLEMKIRLADLAALLVVVLVIAGLVIIQVRG